VTATATDAPVVDDAGRPDPFRRRLLDGLADSICERGYRETTVADIVRHARTSKRTFYGQFSSKEECFVELLWTTVEEQIAKIAAAVDPEAFWQDQIRQAIVAYVTTIETRPAITLSWIRDLPALGAEARPVQRRGFEQFIAMIIDLTDSTGFRRAQLPPVPRPLAVLLLGGLRELAALTVEDGTDPRDIVDPAVSASIAILGQGATAS